MAQYRHKHNATWVLYLVEVQEQLETLVAGAVSTSAIKPLQQRRLQWGTKMETSLRYKNAGKVAERMKTQQELSSRHQLFQDSVLQSRQSGRRSRAESPQQYIHSGPNLSGATEPKIEIVDAQKTEIIKLSNPYNCKASPHSPQKVGN